MTATHRLRRFTATVAILYAIVLLLIAFWPTPVDRPASDFIDRVVGWFARHGLDVVTYGVIEAGANVLLFIPAGLLLVVLLGLPWWWLSILGGVAASVVIELGQYLFLDERFATSNDIYANTIGTVIGTLIGVIALLIARWADAIRHRRAQAAVRVRSARAPSRRP